MRARILFLAALMTPAAAASQESPQRFTFHGLSISSFAVGHQYRQDDWPALAAAPDGSLWLAWLSFNGAYDDVAIRHYQNGMWSNIHWLPNTSGDNWLPQIAVDSANRPWVVWSQQKNGNWDLYARRFDAAQQEWGELVRLTADPLPDINPRLTSNGKGQFALVWQGWRGRNSNVFLKTFDGRTWSPEVRVTNRPANDWEPAVALDRQGAAWVVYDSYKNGNYDVFLSRVQGGRADPEIPVAVTPLFEARATVAVDAADRVWVAWEEGLANWGKDQGYIIKDRPAGAFLGGVGHARIRCYQNGRWLEPVVPLSAVFAGDRVSQPHVFAGANGLWVAAKIRHTVLAAKKNPPDYYFPTPQKGYWEYWATRLAGDHWAPAFALPASKGRSSTRISATWDTSGTLWMAWPTDGRVAGDYHRPIRQQVFAASIEGGGAGAPPALKPAAAPTQFASSQTGHTDEPGDLRAIRAYTVAIDGRPNHILRGDFHRHTELSWDRGGEPDGSLQDFYRYMIDAAGMDFGASTDHQGGAWPYWWWYTEKMTDMYHVPGAYVPIFGYERSAQYPFGHRNIFFAKRTDARVTPFFLKEGVQRYALPVGAEGDEPGSGSPDLVKNDSLLLYEEIQAHHGLAIRHTTSTNQGGLWNENDPNLEPVVEIFQGARTSSEQVGGPLVTNPAKDTEQMNLIGYHPEGMISVAWAKGYKLGVIASSDHFSTHISYAMVYTADPTRQGILDAIRRRHTYGATDNIILDVHMGDHFMGDEFQLARAEPMRIQARGTRPIALVEILKDGKVIYATAPGRNEVSFEFNDAGGVTGRHYYYVRLQQDDRMTAWSSPFFVNYR